MIKENKIKKAKIGSNITISRRLKKDKLNIFPTTDDQKPTPLLSSSKNPGGAIGFEREQHFPLENVLLVCPSVVKSIINRLFQNHRRTLSRCENLQAGSET
ncbi:MAG: hypothetical protein ABFS35_23840, partial [Bacteroidota bacterium]